MFNSKKLNKANENPTTTETNNTNNTKEDNNIDNTKEKDEEVTNTLEKTPQNNEEYKNLQDGEYITEKGYTLTIKNGIAYIDDILIVNKTYSLPQDYKPTNTYQEIENESCINCLDKEVMTAFKLMQSDAKSLGLNIYLSSGYRSYNYQNRLYNNYTAVSGQAGADTYSARPGYSEHQTGLCFDLNEVASSFATTNEGIWVQNNAHLYGFIIRYPEGKENITGYMYESWHLRYVGKELASKLYNNSNWITLEEYFGISSSYY